jgi:hypothetical protein
MSDLRTAAEYRRLAAFFRDRAPLPSLQKTYLKVADGYERLAEKIEEMEAADQDSAPYTQARDSRQSKQA